METKTLVGGLIAVIFSLVIGTVYLYPYYIETDTCVSSGSYGTWENVTEKVYFNASFPAIARYYCSKEAKITKEQCLLQDKLINSDGCKWGGKVGGTTRLYVMEDPEVSITSDSIKSYPLVDVGLEKSEGIKMDWIENGLTYKCLGFEITKGITTDAIAGIILDTASKDTVNPVLSKKSINNWNETRNEIDKCTKIEITPDLNGTKRFINNCTYKNIIVTHSDDIWTNVKIDNTEITTNRLDGVKLQDGNYKYCFNVPFGKSNNGWGSSGEVKIALGNNIYIDRQHSSWWNTTFTFRQPLPLDGSTEMIRKWTTAEAHFDSTSADFNPAIPYNFAVACNGQQVSAVFANNTDLKKDATSFIYGALTGYKTANTTLFFRVPMNISVNNLTACYLYGGIADYDASAYGFANKSEIALLYADWQGKANGESLGGQWHNGTVAIDTNRLKCIGWEDVPTGYAYTPLDTGNCTDCEKWEMDIGFASGPNNPTYDFIKLMDIADIDSFSGGLSTDSKGRMIMPRREEARVNIRNTNTDASIKTAIFTQTANLQYDFKLIAYDDINSGNYDIFINGTKYPYFLNGTATMESIKSYFRIDCATENSLLDYVMIKRYREVPLVITAGEKDTSNTAPKVNINPILPAIAYTNDDLNCSFIATDAEGNDLAVNITWFKDNVMQFSFNISILAGNESSNILKAGNTTKGEVWNCSVVAYDGTAYSTANSTIRTISNSKPYWFKTLPLVSTGAGSYTNDSIGCTDLDGDVMAYALNTNLSGISMDTRLSSQGNFTFNPSYISIGEWQLNASCTDGTDINTTLINWTVTETVGGGGNPLCVQYLQVDSFTGIEINYNLTVQCVNPKADTNYSNVTIAPYAEFGGAVSISINANSTGQVSFYNTSQRGTSDGAGYTISGAVITENITMTTNSIEHFIPIDPPYAFTKDGIVDCDQGMYVNKNIELAFPLTFRGAGEFLVSALLKVTGINKPDTDCKIVINQSGRMEVGV